MRIQRAEVELVGDVNGKSLLHLQCHFGLDTLSWARLGARVTGVDFSAPAIEQAEALAAELAIPSRFVCSDVYTLPEHLEGEFDIVYTSWGVLCWLPDLAGWSSVVARFLKPGGRFHLFEFHPVADVFDDQLRPAYRYFFEDEGYREHWDATYADLDADVHGESWEWSHPVSEIVGSLLAAGLRLERLDEFPWIPWPRFRGLVPGRLPRTWELPTGHLPLSLHIEASR
jgi:SAM-dependent methyltransferase